MVVDRTKGTDLVTPPPPGARAPRSPSPSIHSISDLLLQLYSPVHDFPLPPHAFAEQSPQPPPPPPPPQLPQPHPPHPPPHVAVLTALMNAVIAVKLLATEAMVATAASAPTFVASFTEYLHVEGREHEHVREALKGSDLCTSSYIAPTHDAAGATCQFPTRPEYFLLT
jgi:hypothetical protein